MRHAAVGVAGKPMRRIFLWLVVAAVLPFGAAAWGATDPAATLEVSTEPSGGVRATATLLIPAPPPVVQAVLTDYERWPELFSTPMSVTHLERRAGGAVTDLFIKHSFLPGGRRLFCDNQELPEGGLVSTLRGGDFKQYVRTWKVAPDGEHGGTRASFELLVDVDTWAPDWLVAFELRRQLKQHFRLLLEKILARAAGQPLAR
ncbi:MAG: hypothetical protein EPO64_08320 [Nitrospirae bacterium]|nr:MAG: hypothetical protein EPO64_08320 [Nitrospirota bacterium]